MMCRNSYLFECLGEIKAMAKLSKVVVFSFLMIPALALSNTLPPVAAYVVGAGTYTDGSIYVFFDRPISSCSSMPRFDLPVGHVALKNTLAIALAAFTSGSAVRVHPGACSGSTPVFSTGDSYLYLTKEIPG